jgi:ABC-type nitrate/sulfonate/bicarbonate transport system ATPase subunit
MRVEMRQVSFTYPGPAAATPVLSQFDLVLESGSVHALVGPSGCGKSTVLRLLARLEVPTAGTIDFRGEPRHPNLTALVFQTPRLIPWWTVERNVAIGSEFTEVPDQVYRKIADFNTSRVGLGKERHRRPHTLSHGQQSRAGLGRGLAYDADVMLLDEPFAHLDALSRRRLYEEVETFWQLSPRTTVLVTHDVEEAVFLSDRVSVMSARPGPLVDTIEVDAGRPRQELSPAHPGLRGAIGAVWRALEA